MTQITFGAFIPQGWKMELSSISGAEAKWAKAVEVAVLAEELGYDSIWVYDHFHNVPVPAHEAVFECWTVIAAISQRTNRVRLGQMVGCAPYRSPALLAKVTSTIDVISGGRLDWGIGAGWYDHEFRGYGYEFAANKDRIGMLRETVEIVKAMWSEPDVSYDGRYYQLQGAQCDPKPVQKPHPPVWIGGGGEQLTLRVVARHADYSNFGGKPHEWAHKAEVLKQHCKAVGRDYDEITKTIAGELFIRETEQELVEGGTKSMWGEPLESWRQGNLVGTPDEVAEKIQTYIDLGCTGFVPWCSDYPETESLRLLAEKVIPSFR
ncbi:MAG TPA: LLM class F420-dependent oxidoreductase [Acidimicrobiales bacterium]|jgi:F420-dependent oxidoreductase-like protein|nr:LLM class F420-dependent oxidoreductase [Acidimicrobiales bacterium]